MLNNTYMDSFFVKRDTSNKTSSVLKEEDAKKLKEKCLCMAASLIACANHTKQNHIYLSNLLKDNYQIYSTAKCIDIILDDTSLNKIDQAEFLANKIKSLSPKITLEDLQTINEEAITALRGVSKLSEDLANVIKASKTLNSDIVNTFSEFIYFRP